MPYLICDKCNVYYEIENKREINDFHVCRCGNELKYYETIEEYMNEGLEGSSNLDDNIEKHSEDTQGIFYSINKKNLVTLQMEMLKEEKETKKKERYLRDLNYRIRHAMVRKKEKEIMDSKIHDHYEPLISREFKDKNSLKKRKEMLLKEMELLKKAKGEK